MLEIPKKIFFIWFGNTIPQYVYFCIDSFKNMNPDYEIIFINKTVRDIENIYTLKNINNLYDKLLYTTIELLIKNNNKMYQNYIQNQKTLYGKNIRFIQILSDIYRVYLINSIGGIYLDCDTFPLNSFNDILLKRDFCVAKHFSKNIISVDNYFFGFTKKDFEYQHIIPIPLSSINILKLLQTDISNNKLHNEIQRKKFFDCTLNSADFNKKTKIYIKHFCKNSWNTKNIINIPFSKLDKFLENKIMV